MHGPTQDKGHSKTAKKISIVKKSGKNAEPYNDQVLTHPKFRFRKKMAAFDYDHTLVKPTSGPVFSQKIDDWQWLRPNVKNVLIGYYQRGYSIVIFTNQSRKFKTAQIKLVLDTLIFHTRRIFNITNPKKNLIQKFLANFPNLGSIWRNRFIRAMRWDVLEIGVIVIRSLR